MRKCRKITAHLGAIAPPAELEVRDRTVLKMLGKEERPFTILYTGSKLSIGICPRHRALLKWLFFFPQCQPGEVCRKDTMETKISIGCFEYYWSRHVEEMEICFSFLRFEEVWITHLSIFKASGVTRSIHTAHTSQLKVWTLLLLCFSTAVTKPSNQFFQ